MQIRVFGREAQLSTLADLRNTLSTRNGSVASFWLSSNDGSSLAVMVRDESACVHYFPNQEHPGFYAVGVEADWENQVAFVADNYETTEVPVAMVIPWSEASAAAEEFFRSKSRPASLQWEEL